VINTLAYFTNNEKGFTTLTAVAPQHSNSKGPKFNEAITNFTRAKRY
jgi:hypothetical protein